MDENQRPVRVSLLIISAANWPLFGRNPNDGAVFLRGDTVTGLAPELIGDGQSATHTLFLDGTSRIELEVQ